MDMTKLDELILLLQKRGVKHFNGFYEGCYQVTLEFWPENSRSVPTASPVDGSQIPEVRDLCPCGHSKSTEHNVLGCLYACSTELCSSKDNEEPRP